MSTSPGDIANALKDALPKYDYDKVVSNARRVFGIVLLGDAALVDELIALLRGTSPIPSDVRLSVWRFEPGTNPPVSLAQTELAIALPANEESVRQAGESFKGVPLLPIVLGAATAPANVANVLRLTTLDAATVRRVFVPALVERMRERRIPLGRALPATRDHISWGMIRAASRDRGVLLGSVAGAGGGRRGTPTAPTAALVIHQAALILQMAAVYGIDLDDRRAVFARVAPHLAPTVLIDRAEAFISKLASGRAGKDNAKLVGTAAAVVARPVLSVSSTIATGLLARRVFRGTLNSEPIVKRVASGARTLGRRAVSGASQGAALAVAALGARVHLRRGETVAETDSAAATAEVPGPQAEAQTDDPS